MLSIIYLVQIFKKWYEITKLHFKTLSNFLLHETLWSSHNIQLSLWMTKVCVCRDITVYLDKLDYHNFKYGGSNNLGCDGDHIQIIWKSVISLMKHEKTMLKKSKDRASIILELCTLQFQQKNLMEWQDLKQNLGADTP